MANTSPPTTGNEGNPKPAEGASAKRAPLPGTAGNPRLLSALVYVKRGFAVLPCVPGEKRPATRHGVKDATTDKAFVVRAWSAQSDANVAIATGAASRIVVLDVDPRNGGDASLAELERQHGELPDTLRVSTGGGGRHYYFRAEGPVPSGVLAPGLDVKGDGGYVVAPPSVHPNGTPYRWENAPATKALAAPPAWLIVSKRKQSKAASTPTPPDAATSLLGRRFASLGMLGRLLDAGKRSVVCPWQAKHTTGSVHDSSTVIFPANSEDGLGGFHCFHAHCASRSGAEVLRELDRLSAAGAAEEQWMANLRRTPKGDIKLSFGNVVQILTHDTTYANKLRLDEMRGVVMLGDVEVTDAAIGAIRVDFENRYSIQAGDAETARAVQLVAAKNAFHPVRDVINSLKWDGVPRLDCVASRILRVRAESDDERALLALLVRRWFIAFVARPLSPGCKVDTALILEGAQGVGKSTFFRVLAGKWFSDTEMALDKDAMMQLRNAWAYEWAELETVTGSLSNSRVKAFLTSTEDKYRPPFGRAAVTVKRSGVIVGTTNTHDFLRDPSGSRRFWVVPVGLVDSALLREQREQLIAEAAAAFRTSERYWLSEEEEARREALAERFVEVDPWEERVIDFAQAQARVRTTEVLQQGLGLPLDRLTKRDEMRVSAVLRRGGWRAEQSRVEGKVTRYWVKAPGRDSRDSGDNA